MKTAAEIIEQRSRVQAELKEKKLAVASAFLKKIQKQIESDLLKEGTCTQIFSTHDVGLQTIESVCEYLNNLGYLASFEVYSDGDVKISINLPR